MVYVDVSIKGLDCFSHQIKRPHLSEVDIP